MEKIYFVEFEKKEHSTFFNMIFHCMANNAKEARAKAEKAWKESNEKARMLHVYAKKSRIYAPELLLVTNIMGQNYKGATVLDRFILVDLHK